MWFERWMETIWQKPPTVIFTNGLDVRILKTARKLAETGLASPLIIGNQFEIRSFAEQHKIRLSGVPIRKPLHHQKFDWYCRYFRKHFAPQEKISTVREALQNVHSFALQMLLHGDAHLVFLTQQDFTQTLEQISRWLTSSRAMMSSFALIWDESQQQLMAFADPTFYPRPEAEQLAQITIATARNFEKLTGQRAKVALLSFSTKGSAHHPMVEKVQQAVHIVRQQEPHLLLEGELQFDAALIAEIGRKKAPNNRLNGPANVYIFPSLNAANIGLKLVAALTPFHTLSPIIQGLKHSVQMIEDDRCEESLFRQIIVASNLLNA